MDSDLPAGAYVLPASARVCSDGRERAGVVWVRVLDGDDGRRVNQLRMAILGRDHILATASLSGVDLSPLLAGNLEFMGTSWQALLPAVLAGHEGSPEGDGLALVKFGPEGWPPPRIVSPIGVSAGCWVFEDNGHTDLFWLCSYSGPGDLPEFMGGVGSQRVDHVHIKEGQIGAAHTAYRRPNSPGRVYDRGEDILHVGRGRYDMLLLRDRAVRGRSTVDLIHVSNLLGKPGGKAQQIGKCASTATVKAVALPPDRIQVLWMENKDIPLGPTPPVRTVRLVETHMIGGSWSPPRVLTEGTSWTRHSLAAAAFTHEGRPAVLAVWQAGDDRLTYSVGVGTEWSQPTSTNLIVGPLNHLVRHDQGFMLVTEKGDERLNLFWTRLRLTSQATRPSSGPTDP